MSVGWFRFRGDVCVTRTPHETNQSPAIKKYLVKVYSPPPALGKNPKTSFPPGLRRVDPRRDTYDGMLDGEKRLWAVGGWGAGRGDCLLGDNKDWGG